MMQIEENGHQMGFSRKFMMENAGAAATKRLVEKLGDVKSKNVLVFAGLGNNGGDGLVIARHLAGYGSSVSVFLLGQPDNIRKDKLKESNRIFNVMENLYLILYPFAMFDKIVKEARRKLDVNRSLVEESRAIITEEIRRNHFVKALTEKEK